MVRLLVPAPGILSKPHYTIALTDPVNDMSELIRVLMAVFGSLPAKIGLVLLPCGALSFHAGAGFLFPLLNPGKFPFKVL